MSVRRTAGRVGVVVMMAVVHSLGPLLNPVSTLTSLEGQVPFKESYFDSFKAGLTLTFP
jgi:hypothetical protein